MSFQKMIVYIKTGCPWCIGLTTYLNENGVEFEERNVTEDEEFMKEMVEKSNQTKAPVVDVGGHIIADTDKDEIAKYLEDNR